MQSPGTEVGVVDVIDIADTVPSLPPDLVDRESSIKTVERTFQTGVEIVLLEGPEGIGKTTLACQFARSNPSNTVAIFFRALGASSLRTQDIIFDLSNQIYWLLNGARLPESVDADLSLLNQLWLRLTRRASAKGSIFYIVIDGLVPKKGEESNYLWETVAAMFPFGSRVFRFLVTGEADRFFLHKEHKFHWKSYLVDPFGIHETSRYLFDFKLDKDRVTEIHRVTDGIPAKLASVKRILSSGTHPSRIIDQCDASLSCFFDLEWVALGLADNPQLKLVLSILAFDDRRWTIDELSELAGIVSNQLAQELRSLSFITIDNAGAQYVSDAFRSYAQKQLSGFRKEVLDKIIEHLLASPTSADSLASLPSYLEQAGRHSEILHYLSVENLSKLLEMTKTLMFIHRNIDLGLAVSRRTKSDEDYIALTLVRGVLSDLRTVEAWKDEVEALLSLERYDEALTLAGGASLAEDQLQLFCVLARWKKEQGETPEAILTERINEIYKKLDPIALGHEKALDIASDMFAIDPESAIDLVTQSVGTDESENALDWALTRLSIAAAQKHETVHGVKDALELLRDKVSSTKAKRIFSLASMLVGPATTEEVVSATKRLERTSDRLFLLRQWIVENGKRSDIGTIIQHAIDVAIADTEYSPSAAFYRDISAGLVGVSNREQFKTLATLLDGQRGTALHKGPTPDYIRFQLNVANAEAKFDKGAAAKRLEELYLDVVFGILDPDVRGLCLAWFLAHLALNDQAHFFEQTAQLHTVIDDDLKKCVNTLLATTADHYEITRGILEPLATAMPYLAFEIASSLNIQPRRDEAYADIVRRVSQQNRLDLDTAKKAISVAHTIVDREKRDDSLRELATGIRTKLGKTPSLTDCIPLLSPLVGTISSLPDRCVARAQLYLGTKSAGLPGDEDLRTDIASAWSAIVSPWRKISTAFEIAGLLAKTDAELAVEYTKQADAVRRVQVVQTDSAARVVTLTVSLLVQSARGLIVSGAMTRQEADTLGRVIRQLSSPTERAIHWGRIACSYLIGGQLADVKGIVANQILPALAEIDSSDLQSQTEALTFCAPAMWYAQREICKEKLSRLSRRERDSALVQICLLIFRKVLPGDPYDATHRPRYSVSYVDIRDTISVLSEIEGDTHIYFVISMISDAVIHGHRRSRSLLTREQISAIASEVELAIQGKLPATNYIAHQGYAICCRAQIARIRGEKSTPAVRIVVAPDV